MKLLERERTADDGTTPEPAPEAPAADPGVRTCASCGAELQAGQDWCLNCGAATGALGERPGWRAAMTALGLVLVLVAGAVAAAFAALSDDPTRTVVASTPPATAPAAVPPAATTPTTPEDGADGETGTLPEVDPPSSTSGDSPGRVTPTPTSSTPAPTPAPAPTPSPSDSGSTTTPGSSGSGGGTNTTTTPSTPAAKEIEIGEDQVSAYDPYGRARAVGAPAKAIDGDRSTSWYVDAAPGSPQIGMGYLVDVGEARGIRRIQLRTPTPGFRVEIYATDEATAPPNILDSRWAHIRDKDNVGADRDAQPEKIVLGAGSSKYRNVLLWITQPPATGTRVRISELQLFG